MGNEEILNLRLENEDFPEDLTIKGYLKLLLKQLWEDGEAISGARPVLSGWTGFAV